MHVSSDDCMVFTNARANQVAFLYPYLQHFSSDCPIASDGHLVFLFGIGCTLLQFPVAVDPPTPFLMLMDESTPLPTSVLIVWMTAYFVEMRPFLLTHVLVHWESWIRQSRLVPTRTTGSRESGTAGQNIHYSQPRRHLGRLGLQPSYESPEIKCSAHEMKRPCPCCQIC